MFIVYTTLFICELNLCKLQSHKVRRRKQETNNYSQPGWTVRRTDTFTFKSFSREINSLDGSGSDWAREGWGGRVLLLVLLYLILALISHSRFFLFILSFILAKSQIYFQYFYFVRHPLQLRPFYWGSPIYSLPHRSSQFQLIGQ